MTLVVLRRLLMRVFVMPGAPRLGRPAMAA